MLVHHNCHLVFNADEKQWLIEILTMQFSIRAARADSIHRSDLEKDANHIANHSYESRQSIASRRPSTIDEKLLMKTETKLPPISRPMMVRLEKMEANGKGPGILEEKKNTDDV